MMLALLIALLGQLQPVHPTDPGAPIPTALVSDLAGKSLELKSFRGKPLLLNLWASWCAPCKRELPALAELHRRHPGLQVVALSTEQDREAVERAAQRLQLPFTVLYDPEDVTPLAFLTPVIPTTFLYDAEGRLVWFAARVIPADDPDLTAAIEKVLAPKPL